MKIAFFDNAEAYFVAIRLLDLAKELVACAIEHGYGFAGAQSKHVQSMMSFTAGQEEVWWFALLRWDEKSVHGIGPLKQPRGESRVCA